MDGIKPPGNLQLEGNVDEKWRAFKQRFLLYLTAIGASTASGTHKVALLLTVAGPQAIDVYNTFTFDDEDEKNDLDKVLTFFDEYCSPRKNEVYERFVFRSRVQRQGESFDAFLTDLKTKAQTCNFEQLKDSMIRDQVVFGILDKKVREKMLSDSDLTLDGAVKLCHASELSAMHVKTFGGSGTTMMDTSHASTLGVEHMSVDVVNKQDTRGRTGPRNMMPYDCRRCGNRHAARQCPAYGKNCVKCKGRNNFAKMCFWEDKAEDRKTVHAVETEEDPLFVGMVLNEPNQVMEANEVYSVGQKSEPWIAPLLVNDTIVPLKLDTGAKANLINWSDLQNLKNRPKILKKTVGLIAYNRQRIETKGTCRLKVKVKNRIHSLMFVIVPEGHESLLGGKASEDLGLVKRVYTINEMTCVQSAPQNSTTLTHGAIVHKYADVFQGFGALPFTYSIKLREDAKPVIHAPRRVPVALRDRLRTELDRMEGLGVIKRVEEPTDWVNSMVCVNSKKNDKLRVCMDPKDLNANIKREHYQIPKREEIISEMTGARYFSKMDASHGFWQLKLDEESAKLCTFNTPFGRYSYQRLPFGISSAPEIFHRAMEQIIEGLDGVRVYVDDLVVWGSTQEEHDTRLEKTLKRIQEYGLKLNKDKCQFSVSEITFLGDKISTEGVQPDKAKVKAIHDMEKPKDRKGVQRALGMINYLGKFIPNLAVKTTHLRKLLHQETEFQWGHEHDTEWQGLLQVLTSEPLLRFFCPEKRTKVSTDASKDGLGAVLLQEDDGVWRPVAYASRSMTDTECRYAQIEKECLGLAFGCEKCHTYIYGLPKFILETDHKPLLGIAKKNLCDMSPRIQRLMMRLQRYDYELTYVPGTQMFIADTLSRAALCDAHNSESEEDVALHVDMVYAALPATQEQLSKIATETSKDPVLKRVMKNLQEGWKKGSCNQYYHIQSELSVVDGLLLKCDRIVVPTSMRREMLTRVHEGHLGAEKSKRRAREALYWPNMNSDIDQLISECATCQEYHYKQAKEPLITTELPSQPWERVGTDIFHYEGKDYLLVIDYYSNYPETYLLPSTTSRAVITQLKSIFSRQGIPLTLVSDNGPPYASHEFKAFASEYEFNHVTSSPLYPQANGKAEKGVQIVKRLLKKAAHSNTDPYLALMSYRAAPLESGKSPAELLLGRKIRTRLPRYGTIQPEHRDETWACKAQRLQQKQKTCYDRTATALEPLQEKDVVRIEGPKSWAKRATVLQQVAPRSYSVLTENGEIFRRNRKHLLKTKESWRPQVNREGDLMMESRVRDEIGAGAPSDGEHNSDNVTEGPSDLAIMDTSGGIQHTPVQLRRSERIKKPVVKLDL